MYTLKLILQQTAPQKLSYKSYTMNIILQRFISLAYKGYTISMH